MRIAQLWPLTRGAVSDWSEDKVPRLAAALAFYTMLSIGPLLIICLKIIGMIWGEEAAQGRIRGYLAEMAGGKAAEAAQQMIASAGQQSGLLATIVSLAVLLFSASGVFAELQDSLNTIWEVKPRPGRGILGIIKDRFFSVTMVLGTAFLLLVSLVISAILSAFTSRLGGQSLAWFGEIVHLLVSLAVVTALFALILKYLPDVKIPWSDVWLGAILTGVLFTLGKFALGWYLGRASTTSVYGAAGSLVALLLWVYYSSQILFFGAEFTRATVRQQHGTAAVADNALPVTEQERAQQGLPTRESIATEARMTQTGASCPLPGNDGSRSSAVTPVLTLAAGFVVGKLLGHGRTRVVTRPGVPQQLREVGLAWLASRADPALSRAQRKGMADIEAAVSAAAEAHGQRIERRERRHRIWEDAKAAVLRPFIHRSSPASNLWQRFVGGVRRGWNA